MSHLRHTGCRWKRKLEAMRAITLRKSLCSSACARGKKGMLTRAMIRMLSERPVVCDHGFIRPLPLGGGRNCANTAAKLLLPRRKKYVKLQRS